MGHLTLSQSPRKPSRARVGLIIPSGNRLTEAQFNHYPPQSLGIRVARGRVAGKPVVNSNQAVLWGCLKLLKDRLGAGFTPPRNLGRLMNDLEAYSENRL